jgi:hypothetical protein
MREVGPAGAIEAMKVAWWSSAAPRQHVIALWSARQPPIAHISVHRCGHGGEARARRGEVMTRKQDSSQRQRRPAPSLLSSIAPSHDLPQPEGKLGVPRRSRWVCCFSRWERTAGIPAPQCNRQYILSSCMRSKGKWGSSPAPRPCSCTTCAHGRYGPHGELKGCCGEQALRAGPRAS